MASIAAVHARPASAGRFYIITALVMAAIVVLGFSTQLAMGRSSFGAPLRVHIHAVVFMGWVALFVAQAWLATSGPITLHRRLGWIAAGWLVLMTAAALGVTLGSLRSGTVPFFFRPQEFAVLNPLLFFGFLGLTCAAIAKRRETEWHARLHIGAMTMIMGPAFGRLIPMPFLGAYAFEIAGVIGAVFPIAGMIRDKRRSGAVHPAWIISLALLAALLIGGNLIAHSPLGDAIYAAATAGSPGAALPGMEFGTPPPGLLPAAG